MSLSSYLPNNIDVQALLRDGRVGDMVRSRLEEFERYAERLRRESEDCSTASALHLRQLEQCQLRVASLEQEQLGLRGQYERAADSDARLQILRGQLDDMRQQHARLLGELVDAFKQYQRQQPGFVEAPPQPAVAVPAMTAATAAAAAALPVTTEAVTSFVTSSLASGDLAMPSLRF